jgi:hypothetical protein
LDEKQAACLSSSFEEYISYHFKNAITIIEINIEFLKQKNKTIFFVQMTWNFVGLLLLCFSRLAPKVTRLNIIEHFD